MSIDLVIADRRAVARDALRRLAHAWGWEVVAEAEDAFGAVRLARELDPHVIVLDSTAGGTDVGALFDLGPSRSTPLVVRLIDNPQEHASAGDLTILKGGSGERLREVIEEALRERSETPSTVT